MLDCTWAFWISLGGRRIPRQLFSKFLLSNRWLMGYLPSHFHSSIPLILPIRLELHPKAFSKPCSFLPKRRTWPLFILGAIIIAPEDQVKLYMVTKFGEDSISRWYWNLQWIDCQDQSPSRWSSSVNGSWGHCFPLQSLEMEWGGST